MFDSNQRLAPKRDVDVHGGGVRGYFRLVARQYRKTIVGVQVLIGIITVAALIQTHSVTAALAFFAVMQFGAVFGAMWAARLHSLVETSGASFGDERASEPTSLVDDTSPNARPRQEAM